MGNSTIARVSNSSGPKRIRRYIDSVRFDLQNALSSTDLPTEAQLRVRDPAAKPYNEMPELVVGIIHQRVFEAFWNDGETFPSRVVVDDVLN